MSRLPTPDKPLPLVLQPPIGTPSLSTSALPEEDIGITVPPSAALQGSGGPDTSKREYALLELLRSERTYASDLVLLRDYQIPLASGRLSSMSSIWPAVESTICQYLGLGPAASDINIGPATPAGASAVASRPLTTASNISAVSFGSIFTICPMKTKDLNIVFSNIQQLATFSEEFLDRLESALGELIEGNEGEDSVGRLFLESIPQMEPLYRTYVMNQHRALEHYHRLSETFQFDVYFPRSQILAHKSSNAWDLPSLLIKPVQRLLHYPQLLAAILAETPDSHRDKADLVKAHARMGEIARGLNARWMQQKAVRDVLASAGLIARPKAGGDVVRARKKSGLKIGFPASVNLATRRAMTIRMSALKVKERPEVNYEAEKIKTLGERLNEYKEFMARFTMGAVKWVDAMHDFVGALEEWAKGFEGVIWLDTGTERSDAFDMFRALISDQCLQVCDSLKAAINEGVLQSIASLMGTTVAPTCLLEALQTLKPLHYGLLSLPAANSRRPPHLVEASESYVALCAQLLADLPTYLNLLDRGMAVCIRKFAHIQWRFYAHVRDLWAGLWDCVRVDQEANEGAAETLQVWWNRYHDVQAQVTNLKITQMPAPEKAHISAVLAALDPLNINISSDFVRARTISSASTDAMYNVVVVVPKTVSSLGRKIQSGAQVTAPALYECRVVHPCEPPEGVEYRDIPFFTLVVGEVYEILQEAGHPSAHHNLPLYMDDGEDCLLLARNGAGDVGWALASFMTPVD